jgi:Flp pilus assembly protein TadG
MLRRLWKDPGGSVATTFALLLPAIALLACGAIDLYSVWSDKSAMQDTADATALAMAKQMSISTDAGLSARATDFANAELGPIAQADAVQVSVTRSLETSSVTVTISGHRASFFGNLLPPGGWQMNASATASALGSLPLCVLSYGTTGPENLHLTGQSTLTAAGCLVQSNGNMTVDKNASLTAGLAQTVGVAQGPISPAPQSGAPSISDPFSSLDVSVNSGGCNPSNVTYLSSGTNTLDPGVHCGNYVVQNGAVLQLLPGEHYFVKGQLQLQGAATLSGDDVVLIFDKSSQFNFQDQAIVNLGGRKSGTFAGFVIATTRLNTGNFQISATSAEKLEGVIYIPSATLTVQGTSNKVAQQSAWTVVVAQSIQLNGSADLVINSNYAASSVPVPQGVGNETQQQVSLVR